MGILDEAIREHLELKRQHGAGDPELKQLEDEAFGPPPRPEELMAEGSEQAQVEQEPATELLTEPPAETEPQAEAEPEQAAEPPGEDDEPPVGPSTEESERQVIAEQPTEFFDVEGEYASEPQSPSEEELAAEEIAEPRLAPADSLAGLESLEGAEIEVAEEKAEVAGEDEDEDDFFDEQRLSEELDQALEAPRDDALPELEDEEVAAEEIEEPEEIEASAPAEEVREEPISEEADREEHEDVLEETPDFLEETPEDDELWFEQKPPKDFDFDD